MFERRAKVSIDLLEGITKWTQGGKKYKHIDKDGYLTKGGLKLLRRIRYIQSYEKWDLYDEFHLSYHVQRIWKYLKDARSTYTKPKSLKDDEWEYLNTYVLLENLGAWGFKK